MVPTPKKSPKDLAEELLRAAQQQEAELELALPAFNISMEDKASKDEKDAKAPLLEAIYQAGGQPEVVSMTNFSTEEIENLWSYLYNHVYAHWNVGQGRKIEEKPKDVYVMLLAVLQRGKP